MFGRRLGLIDNSMLFELNLIMGDNACWWNLNTFLLMYAHEQMCAGHLERCQTVAMLVMMIRTWVTRIATLELIS